MMSSCGRRCCCWWCYCSDCYENPLSGHPHSQHRPLPPSRSQIYDRTYGTYQMSNHRTKTIPVLQQSSNDASYLDYENTVSRTHEEADDEVFYQPVNTADELLDREERKSSVVLDTKRISFQPSTLYNKLSSVTSRNNWSLRQQPFFNEVSSSSRMTNRLIESKLDESFEFDSCDGAAPSKCPPSPRCHKFPVYTTTTTIGDDHHGRHPPSTVTGDDRTLPPPPRGLPASRMEGYASQALPSVFASDKSTPKYSTGSYNSQVT